MIIYLIIIFCLTSVFVSDTIKINRKTGDYQYLIFVQNWPLTSYWKHHQKWISKENDCNLSEAACSALPKNNWTVHGLRPNKNVGRHPSFCLNDKLPFNSTSLKGTLRIKLDEKWVSYRWNRTEENLWEFEWNKHGSCLSDHENFTTESNFFLTTLNLLERYDIGKILTNINIVPGHSYEFNLTLNAINEKLKVRPIIKCATHQDNGTDVQYFDEIHLCMNRSFILRDCIDKSNCDNKRKVLYPKWTVAGNTS